MPVDAKIINRNDGELLDLNSLLTCLDQQTLISPPQMSVIFIPNLNLPTNS